MESEGDSCFIIKYNIYMNVAEVAGATTELPDGYYAFTTNISNECVKMIHNPSVIESGRTTFKIDSNSEISGEKMSATFVTLQDLCEKQLLGGEPSLMTAVSLFIGAGSRVIYLLSDKIVSLTYGDFINYESWSSGETSIRPTGKLTEILKKKKHFLY